MIDVVFNVFFVLFEMAVIILIVLFFPLFRCVYHTSHRLRRLILGRQKSIWTDLECNTKSVAASIPGFLAESPSIFHHHNQWMIISSFVFKVTKSDPDVDIIDEEGIQKALLCCQIRHPFMRMKLLKPNPVLGKLAPKELMVYGLSHLQDAPQIPVIVNSISCPAYEFNPAIADIMSQESQSTKKVSGYEKTFVRLTIHQNTVAVRPNEYQVCFMFFMNHGFFDGKSLSTVMKDMLTFYTKKTDPEEYLVYCRVARKKDEEDDALDYKKKRKIAQPDNKKLKDAAAKGAQKSVLPSDKSSEGKAPEQKQVAEEANSKSFEQQLPRLVEINEETIVLEINKMFSQSESDKEITLFPENESSSSSSAQNLEIIRTELELEMELAKHKEMERQQALSDLPKLEKLLPTSLDPMVMLAVKVSPWDLLKSGYAHFRFLIPFFGKLPIPLKSFKESALKTSRLYDTLYAKIRGIRAREEKEAEEKIHPATNSATSTANGTSGKKRESRRLESPLDEEILTIDDSARNTKNKSTDGAYKNDMSDIDYNDVMTEEALSLKVQNTHPLCEGTRFLPFVLSKEETKFILGQVKQNKCTLHGLLTVSMLFATLELTNELPDPDKEEIKRPNAKGKDKLKEKKEAAPKKPLPCEAPINTLVNARNYLGMSPDSVGDYIQMIKDPVKGLFLNDQEFLDDRPNFWKLAKTYSNNVKYQIESKSILTNSLFEAVFVPPSFRQFSVESIVTWTIASLPSGRMNEFPISNLGVCADLSKPFESEELKMKFTAENLFFGVCEHLFGPIVNSSIVTVNGKLNWTVTASYPLLKDDEILLFEELIKKYLLWEMDQQMNQTQEIRVPAILQ